MKEDKKELSFALWFHRAFFLEEIKTKVEKAMNAKQNGRSFSGARKITTTGILTAIAYLLMILEFPVPLVPSFIKMDFSELPALLASFALGPWYGALVCLLKNLLHMPFSSSLYIGELSNFLLGCCFVVPAGYLYHRKKDKKHALIGSLVGAVVMAAVSLGCNYYLIYPLYGKFMNFTTEVILSMYQALLPSVQTLPEALLIFNVPFTLVKGLIDVVLTFLVYKRISPLLHGVRK